jgi:hypothetical protein
MSISANVKRFIVVQSGGRVTVGILLCLKAARELWTLELGLRFPAVLCLYRL